MLVKVESLTEPHVLAGPGHVVVEGEVTLQPSLHPLTGAPLLLALKTGLNINGMNRQGSIFKLFFHVSSFVKLRVLSHVLVNS